MKSSKESKTQKEEIFLKYMSENKALVVDPVSSSRTALILVLAKLGMPRSSILTAENYEEAMKQIKQSSPGMILSDFELGPKSGLDLVVEKKNKDSIFIVVTGNASQSNVAKAAEEDVDGFLIKPYTMEMLKRVLINTVDLKLNPSPYLELIEKGKVALFSQKYDEAIQCLCEAKLLNSQPTLACFYLGQVEMMKKMMESAEGYYDAGLQYNKIHYKCLVGLFDLLYANKRNSEAYDIIKKISQYFPANPKRMVTVLRLAIMTDNFQDMEGYYRVFLKIDNRSDDLIRYMCSALVVTGKHYLASKVRSRAMEVFENAAVSAAGKTTFISYIVENLVDYKMKNEASHFAERITRVAPGSSDDLSCRFLVGMLGVSTIEAIHLGRKMIKEGAQSAKVYEKLIALCHEAGQRDIAEQYYDFAIKKWPDRKNSFNASIGKVS